MEAFAERYDDAMREFTEDLLRFDTTEANEAPAQAYVHDRLDELGFATYRWEADAERLAAHPSFPDDPAEIAVEDRPNVAGVVEFGDPDAGPTLVLNGHVDVVPVARESWSSDPFEPTWDASGESLTARGAVDMKSALAACVFAAKSLADTDPEIDGRVVVESVVGEEEGGIGAAAAACSNPYSFERDAAVIAEPTESTPITASEGCLMKRLRLTGRAAHAASRWRGIDLLSTFETIRQAFLDLEAERDESVTHPLYEEFPIAWPVVIGRVEVGEWAASVPGSLTAELRIGVAPGETVNEVEAAFGERLARIVAEDAWLSDHPPDFERFSIQFEPAEIHKSEPVVGALQRAMDDNGLEETDPRAATYGADARHYIAAGIPTVLFGPGTIDRAHFPDETVEWAAVLTAGATLADTAREFLGE